MKFALALSVVVASVASVSAWTGDYRTSCSAGGCTVHRGSDWNEVSSSCCSRIWGWCLMHRETCRPPSFTGRSEVDDVFQSCRWNGCNTNNCDSSTEAEVHSSSCNFPAVGNNELCCKPKSRDNLIGDLLSQFPDRSPSLFDLPLIGTHHSPTHDERGACVVWQNSRCQDFSVQKQLESGIRAFDFRPALEDGEILHYHGTEVAGVYVGCYYNTIRGELQTIKNFLVQHPNEIVILLFQNYRELSGDIPRFKSEVSSALSGVNVITRSDTASGWPLLRDLIAQNKRIVIVTDNTGYFDSGVAHSWSRDNGASGTSSDFAGGYHNTNNGNTLKSRTQTQINNLGTKRSNSGGRGSRGYPLAFIHFYLTPSAGITDDNTPWGLAYDAGVHTHNFGSYLSQQPLNVVWLDYALEKKSHMLYAKMYTENHINSRWPLTGAASLGTEGSNEAYVNMEGSSAVVMFAIVGAAVALLAAAGVLVFKGHVARTRKATEKTSIDIPTGIPVGISSSNPMFGNSRV